MYISIITTSEKRLPGIAYKQPVYTNPRVEKMSFGILWVAGTPFERTPMRKYAFILNHTWREDGNLHKKQWQLGTLSYWDIVTAYLEVQIKGGELFDKACWYLTENMYNHSEKSEFQESTTELTTKLKLKFQEIATPLIEEYLTTEEGDASKETIRCCREVVEQEKKQKAEEAEYKRKSEEYQRQSRKAWEESFNRHTSKVVSGGLLSGTDGKLALEIINKGYKALAMSKHPDQGGSDEEFIHLQEVCEKLRGLVAE